MCPGCSKKKGLIIVNCNEITENEFMLLVLDAGADDLQRVGDVFQVICSQTSLDAVKKSIESKHIKVETSEVSWIPKNNIDLDEVAGRKVLGIMDALEDHDDVQNVYSNFNLPQVLLDEMQTTK